MVELRLKNEVSDDEETDGSDDDFDGLYSDTAAFRFSAPSTTAWQPGHGSLLSVLPSLTLPRDPASVLALWFAKWGCLQAGVELGICHIVAKNQ